MGCPPGSQTLEQPFAESLSEVETNIRSQLHGRVREFRLMVQLGGLVLKGASHTYFGKLLAQHLTVEATSMPILANEIEVVQCRIV